MQTSIGEFVPSSDIKPNYAGSYIGEQAEIRGRSSLGSPTNRVHIWEWDGQDWIFLRTENRAL
jgi:hypothetical protein